MALAGECEHGTVMNEPVNNGGRGHLVGEDLGPLFERKSRSG